MALALFVGIVGLVAATQATRGTFRDADLGVKGFAREVVALDRTLRNAGEEGELSRTLLFGFTEHTTRALFPATRHGLPAAPEATEVLLDALRLEVEALSGHPGMDIAATAANQALRSLLDEVATLEAVEPAQAPRRWLEVALLVVLMPGLAALGLLAGARASRIAAVFALAGMLSGGIFLLEEMATPFDGAIMVSRAPLDAVLYTITD